jgi:hypothetical protein
MTCEVAQDVARQRVNTLRRGMSVHGGRVTAAVSKRLENARHYTYTCETRIRAYRYLASKLRIRCEDLEGEVLREDCAPCKHI